VHSAVAVGQRVQLGKANDTSAARATLFAPRVRRSYSRSASSIPGTRDVMYELPAQAALPHKHRRLADAQPQRLRPQHRLLKAQQVLWRHGVVQPLHVCPQSYNQPCSASAPRTTSRQNAGEPGRLSLKRHRCTRSG
jgi:hypothetical protein